MVVIKISLIFLYSTNLISIQPILKLAAAFFVLPFLETNPFLILGNLITLNSTLLKFVYKKYTKLFFIFCHNYKSFALVAIKKKLKLKFFYMKKVENFQTLF